MPGLTPLTAGWGVFVLLGLGFGLWTLREGILDYQAARADGRRLAIIEAQHQLATEIARLTIQASFLAADLVAITSPHPQLHEVTRETVIFSLLYVLAEVLTVALIGLDTLRRFRLNRLAPREFMKAALDRSVPRGFDLQ